MFYCWIDTNDNHESTLIHETGTIVLNKFTFTRNPEGYETLIDIFNLLSLMNELIIGVADDQCKEYLIEKGYEVISDDSFYDFMQTTMLPNQPNMLFKKLSEALAFFKELSYEARIRLLQLLLELLLVGDADTVSKADSQSIDQ